jgi:hypothetical protein
VAKRGSAQLQRKAQRKKAAIAELSDEVESDREQDFVNELSDDDENNQDASDEDQDVEMDWRLGVDLQDPPEGWQTTGLLLLSFCDRREDRDPHVRVD